MVRDAMQNDVIGDESSHGDTKMVWNVIVDLSIARTLSCKI